MLPAYYTGRSENEGTSKQETEVMNSLCGATESGSQIPYLGVSIGEGPSLKTHY